MQTHRLSTITGKALPATDLAEACWFWNPFYDGITTAAFPAGILDTAFLLKGQL